MSRESVEYSVVATGSLVHFIQKRMWISAIIPKEKILRKINLIFFRQSVMIYSSIGNVTDTDTENGSDNYPVRKRYSG